MRETEKRETQGNRKKENVKLSKQGVCLLNMTHMSSGCELFLHPLMLRLKINYSWRQARKSCLRDHVFGFLVEHLGVGEHHAAAHLLIQVPQDVINGFPDLGVIQCHTCREQHKQHSL